MPDKQDINLITFDDFLESVKSFHGYTAPGVIIGFFMIKVAYLNLEKKSEYDVIVETAKCLPDAVQLLTPCTIGNGWLTVFDFGRFALTVYDKHTGDGIRVFIDADKLKNWSELETWFFKLKPKMEQNQSRIIEQIKTANMDIFSTRKVGVNLNLIPKRHRGNTGICSSCKEAYPLEDGDICLGCQGKTPYL